MFSFKPDMTFYKPKANFASLHERNLQTTYSARFPIPDNEVSNPITYKLTVKLCSRGGTGDMPEDCYIEVDANSFLRACLCKQGIFCKQGIVRLYRDVSKLESILNVSKLESILTRAPMEWRYLNGNIYRSLTAQEFFYLFRSEDEEFPVTNPDIGIYSFCFDWFPHGSFPWAYRIDWGRTGQRCLPIIEGLLNYVVGYCINESQRMHKEKEHA